MRSKAKLAVAIPLVVGALLLGGCSGGGSSEPTNTAASDTVRVNFGNPPTSWAPGSSAETGYLRVPYETLVNYGDGGKIEPNLATSWEEAPMSLTLHLRDDVTFHDGTAFDSAAVKANLEYVRDHPGQFSGPLQAVASVDTPDATTAVVNFKFPAPSFLTMLTQRNVFIASPKAIADGSIVTAPDGTGPWAYDAPKSQDGTKWVFTQNGTYWGDKPAFKTVELYAIEDDTAASAALINGEIDITDTVNAQLPTLKQGGMKDLTYPAIRNNIIFFDRAPGGVFGDADVRKALCTSIEMEGVHDLSDSTTIDTPTQHFLEGDPGYNPDIVGFVKADLDKAKQLLAGKSVSGAFPSAPFIKQDLEYFADQMNQLDGVNITVQDLAVPDFIATWASGKYPLGLGQNSQMTPYDWYATWFSANGFFNPSKYESPELKAAADAAIAAGSGDEANALWQKVMAIIIDDEADACAFQVGGQILTWNPKTVSGVAAPSEPFEVNLVNYRDLKPAG